MKKFSKILLIGLVAAFLVGIGLVLGSQPVGKPIPPQIMAEENASLVNYDWGTFRTYFENAETYGTKDTLVAVARINPGQTTHEPHQHYQAEFLMIIEGTGKHHLNGEVIEAKPGDMLYTSPWDWHGIYNTGTEPLVFVVFKWDNKGIAAPPQPGPPAFKNTW